MRRPSKEKVERYFKKIKSIIFLHVSNLLILIFIDLLFLYKDIRIGLIYMFVIISYCFFILNKYKKMKNALNKYILDDKLIVMNKEFDENLLKLINLMNDIGIKNDRINYTENKFRDMFKEIKNEDDFKRLQNKVFDDYKKYKNLTKTFLVTEQTDDVYKALDTLNLNRNITNFTIIKNRHRELLKKYHPDNGSSEYNKVTEINAAYTLLKHKFDSK